MGSHSTIIMYLSTEKRQRLSVGSIHTSHSFNLRNHSLARRTDSFGKQFFRWGYKSLTRLGEEYGRWLTSDKFLKNRCPRPVGALRLGSRSQSPTESHDSRRISPHQLKRLHGSDVHWSRPPKLTVNVNHVKRINAFDSKLYTLLRIFVKIEPKPASQLTHNRQLYIFISFKPLADRASGSTLYKPTRSTKKNRLYLVGQAKYSRLLGRIPPLPSRRL